MSLSGHPAPGTGSGVVHHHPRDPVVWWAPGRTGAGHPHGARAPGSVCPPQELLSLLAGGTRRWQCSLSSADWETLLLPSHSTKISTSFPSVYYREMCKVFSIFFSNITNYNSLGIRGIKMPNFLQSKQGVLGTGCRRGHFVPHLRGVGSSLYRDPSSPSWAQAHGEEPPKGSSVVGVGWG